MDCAKNEQETPAEVTEQLLLKATTMLPSKATPNPNTIQRLFFSFKTSGDRRATHNGAVVTSTTELVTLVNSRDVTQKAKWKAKNRPERSISKIIRRSMFLISCVAFVKQKGSKIKKAIVNLIAAITREGASRCAKRINNEAEETAAIPKIKAMTGENASFRLFN
jgi:hypothetical protein